MDFNCSNLLNRFVSRFFACWDHAFTPPWTGKGREYRINLAPDEKVWAGVINDRPLMPFASDYAMDFYANNKANQLQPLIVLTNKGQFVWSEQPTHLN
jgi:hypothetical protein